MSAVYSVTDLNRYAGEVLSSDPILSSVRVYGEISGCKQYPSGHIYFSLKDKESQVSCVAFKGNASRFSFTPANGLAVVLTARASLYDRDGRFQLIVYAMELAGIGDLFIAYERLKAKLEAEGLFSPDVKKPIPFLPKRIGIITSPKGAVIRDILQILSRRFPNYSILIYPSPVQGSAAAKTLCDGVSWFNRKKNVDVIILARGGGSMEDLFCFNDEKLARQIYASTIPVISAVGHETDFTICDFVSDLRAPTPSAAAELVLPLEEDLYRQIHDMRLLLDRFLSQTVLRKKQKLHLLKHSASLQKPLHRLEITSQRVDRLVDQMQRIQNRRVSDLRFRLSEKIARVDDLSPLKILSRGYSVTTQSDQSQPLLSVRNLRSGDKIRTLLSDGVIYSNINAVETREVSHGRQ